MHLMVYRGKENKATVRLVISGDYDYTATNNLSLRALSDVLQIRMLQQLRENEGEVYSPQVQQRLDGISMASLQQSAKEWLSGDNWISFELLPEQ